MTTRPSTAPRVLTMQRRKGRLYDCGLCGLNTKMSRTHVPPQCAGNDHLVGRAYMLTHNAKARIGRHSDGGLHVYGLCEDCNGVGSVYEAAYKELSGHLEPFRNRSAGFDTISRVTLPHSEIDRGSIARAIVIGAFGLAPTLRLRWPDLARTLSAKDATLPVPDELRLRIALARGNTARIGGMTHGYFFGGPWAQRGSSGEPLAVHAFAECYFPPIAWVLTDADQPVLDAQGWGDITGWLAQRPGARSYLDDDGLALPYVSHPLHTPLMNQWWVELHAEADAGVTEIVECRDLPGPSA